MIQKKNQTQNKYADVQNLEQSHLSIQLSLDGFTYCIINNETAAFVHVVDYEFEEKAQTPEQLLSFVKEVFEQETLLNNSFKSVSVAHKNSLITLVPNTYYESDKLADYLKYSIKVLESDKIAVDQLIHSKSRIVYIPFYSVNDFLKEKYSNLKSMHSSSILISKLIASHEKNFGKYLFVNVAKHSFEIVYVKNGKLQYYNSFMIFSKEDFLYYILFTLEQLTLSTFEQKVLLLGDIDINSPFYKIAQTYIQNLDFIHVHNKSLPSDFYLLNPHMEKHNFFELLHQNQNLG